MATISKKTYKCEKCGNETAITTNHNGSFRGCKKCGDKRAYLVCQTDAGLALFAKQQKEKSELLAKLPASILRTTKQEKLFIKNIKVDGKNGRIECVVRWDDTCCNNHNSFGITGTVWSSTASTLDRYFEVGGCIHDKIAKHFPELKHLIKWHGYSSDGYDYRGANIIYFAEKGDLETARKEANWNDATLEELQNQVLLISRLPMLIEQLKADIETTGMIY